MRWFKHMTASADDEKLSRLMDAHGLEGYGFWWRILEIVAERIEKDKEPSAAYSVSKWCSLLGIHHHKFRKLIRAGADCGLYLLVTSSLPSSYPPSNSEVTPKYDTSIYEVKIPNLLKFRDEYTRKSGQSPDKLRSKEQIQNTDTEKEEKKVSKARTRASVPSYDDMVNAYTRNQDLKTALGEFIVMRKAAKKPFTNAALEHTIRELDKLAGAEDAVKIAILNQSVQRGWLGVFALKEPSRSSPSTDKPLAEKNAQTLMRVIKKMETNHVGHNEEGHSARGFG